MAPGDYETCEESNFQKVKTGMEVILHPGVGVIKNFSLVGVERLAQGHLAPT